MIGLTFISIFLDFVTTSKGLEMTSIFTNFAPVAILFLIVIIFTFIICLYIYKSKRYLFDNVSYDFTHWGVVRHGERTEFSKPWRDISKFKETKAFFILYIGNTDFHIIQKRMLENIGELNDFRNLLSEKINH